MRERILTAEVLVRYVGDNHLLAENTRVKNAW